jgi:hypothetical protein
MEVLEFIYLCKAEDPDNDPRRVMDLMSLRGADVVSSHVTNKCFLSPMLDRYQTKSRTLIAGRTTSASHPHCCKKQAQPHKRIFHISSYPSHNISQLCPDLKIWQVGPPSTRSPSKVVGGQRTSSNHHQEERNDSATTPLFAHASANGIKQAFDVPVPLTQWLPTRYE